MENCIFCKKSAYLQCERCHEYYCSLECQSADWRNHKHVCLAMPALIKSNKQFDKNLNTSINNINDKKPIRKYPDLNLTVMRLPHIDHESFKDISKVSATNESSNEIQISKDSTTSLSEGQKHSLKDDQSEKVEVDNQKINKQTSENIAKKIDEINLSPKNIENRKTKIWKSFPPYNQDFFNAIIQYIDKKNEIVWVSDESWTNDSIKLLTETNRDIGGLENVSQNDVSYGSLVIAPFEDIYYRAEIIQEKNPLNEIRVRLIDYGNDFFVTYTKCKKSIDIIKNTPAMALPIKYSGKLDIGQKIEIRLLDKNKKGIFMAEEIGVKFSQTKNLEDSNSSSIKKIQVSPTNESSNEISKVSTTSLSERLKYSLKDDQSKTVEVDNQKIKKQTTENLTKKIDEINISPKNTEQDRKPKIWKSLRSYNKDFFNAIIQYIDKKNETVWVSDESWTNGSIKLLTETNRDIGGIENASNNDVSYGSLVIAPFEDIYYRAEIIQEKNPLNKIRVRLIDYGNDFFVTYTKCKKTIDIIKNTPAMALPIKYSGKLDIGQKIEIRLLDKDEKGIFMVEEMGVKVCQTKNLEDFNSFSITSNSIISTLKDSFNFKIYHQFDKNKKKAFGLIMSKEENVKKLSELDNILNNENEKEYDISEKSIPSGSYVAAEYELKKWKRGVILGNYENDFLILFIDIAKIKIVNKIKKIPNNFKAIPSLTVCIEFKVVKNKKDFLMQTQELNTLSCKLNELCSKDNTMECNVYIGDMELGTAVFKHFDGNYSKFLGSDSYTYPFSAGHFVRIAQVIDYATVNLSLNDINIYYDNIFDEIGNLSTTQLETDLTVGKIVLVKNEKTKKHERACIISAINDLDYEVVQLETGNLFEVKKDCIKKISDFVRFCPRILRKVSLFILNYMKTQYKSNKGIENLKKYCREKQVFVFEWEKDTAELFFNTDRKVSLNKQMISQIYEESGKNDNINNEVIPAPPTPVINTNKNIEKSIFKLDDVEVVPLKTGTNIRLLILDTSDLVNGIFTASIDNLDYYKKLIGVNQPEILKYCQRDDIEQKYCPTIGELCLTYFEADKLWYRAFCIKEEKKDHFNLMFLDYGNIQITKSENIRKMVKNFLFPCYANTCILMGFPKNCSQNSLKKIHESLHPDSLVTVDKVESVEEQEYLITIKGIEQLE